MGIEKPRSRWASSLPLLIAVFSLATSPLAIATEPRQSGDGNVQWLDRSLFIPLAVVIVKVQARLKNGRLNVGTGVTVAPGVVLTNCHVAGNAEDITVSKRAGLWRVVAQHAVGRHDLCYLKVPKWRGNTIELAESGPPALRQAVGALGYTGGVDLSMSEGRVSATYAYQGSHLIQTTTGFSSGASGGALLDSRARLLGILTFRLPGKSGHYYSVPSDWVRQGMPSEDDWQPVGSPIDEKPFWQGDIDSLPFFMQVAPLQAQGKWSELIALAKEWEGNSPKSVEPLLAQAQALSRTDRLDQAIAVLEKARRIDPQHPQVWFALGQGNCVQATTVRSPSLCSDCKHWTPIYMIVWLR